MRHVLDTLTNTGRNFYGVLQAPESDIISYQIDNEAIHSILFIDLIIDPF